VLLFATDLRDIGPEAVTWGSLLLLSPAISAVGNTVVKRRGARISSLLLNRNGLAIAAVLLWACTLAVEGVPAWPRTRMAIFSVVYLAVLGTMAAFGLYVWLLRWLPASRLSLMAYAHPVIALALGWAVGAEAIRPHTIAGALLVLLGVWAAARLPSRAPAAEPSPVQPA
jgi:drug/metabolite transporter (DMT)-like permease